MIQPFKKEQLGGLALYLDLVPYSIGRSSLYTAEDLYNENQYDKEVYEYYLSRGKQVSDARELLARSLHDYCIRKAMEDFLQPRANMPKVGVMGGHGMHRDDPCFLQIARISKQLTEEGFLMISGGGPGAMEATHFGAWMAGRTDKELEAAMEMLCVAPSFEDKGWLKAAMEVRKRFPQEEYESLGIPTWLYGHEPATPFATHIAKLFDNSIREDSILTLASGGIIFTPGSAGTMQEIFQEAVQNHYLSFGVSSPMIFLGTDFWSKRVPIYTLMQHLLDNGVYKNLKLTLTDDSETILQVLKDETKTDPLSLRQLPLYGEQGCATNTATKKHY